MNHCNKVIVGKIIKSSIGDLINFKLANNLMPSYEGLDLYLKNTVLAELKKLNISDESYVDEKLRKEWNLVLKSTKGEPLMDFYAENFSRNKILEKTDFHEHIKHIKSQKSIELLFQEVVNHNRQDVLEYMVDNKMFALEARMVTATVTSNRKEMLNYMLSNGLDVNGNQNVLILVSVVCELRDMQKFLVDKGARFHNNNYFLNNPSDKRNEWIMAYIQKIEINDRFDNLNKNLDQKYHTQRVKI